MMNEKPCITGDELRRMLLGAYQLFEAQHQMINDLNVYPVPDGDTGTNMLQTLAAVARALQGAEGLSIGEVGTLAAENALLGARGNSGVILSQLLRGIGRGLVGKETATTAQLGKAFQYGILYAYRAVAKPVEGTILTVARAISKGAYLAVRRKEPFSQILQDSIAAGKIELDNTPNLLPALKAAGVVDAGGMGLLVFLEGCLKGLTGETPTVLVPGEKAVKSGGHPASALQLTYPYCTEVLVAGKSWREDEVRQCLSGMGDSLIVAGAGETLKIHVHTDRPGLVIDAAQSWGTLQQVKVDNMAEQHLHTQWSQPEEKRGLGVVSVAPGDGLAQIMLSLGADEIVHGGQTMNPPVEEFIRMIEGGKAEQYILLPNNKNIVLAAGQVKKLLGDKVEVVSTLNIAQGMAALTAFNKEKSLEDNLALMRSRCAAAHEASLSVAVRDSVVNNIAVQKGDYLGLSDGKIVLSGHDQRQLLLQLVEHQLVHAPEIVSFYYGKDVAPETAAAWAQDVRTAFPALEVEVYEGGQPHYPLLLVFE